MFSRLAIALLFFFVCVDADAANRFLTCNTACTITASDTTIWGTTTGGTGASVPGSSDAVVLDGATCVGGTTCTATMGAGYNPTWQSITMGACTASTTGCIFDWSVNNNNVTLNLSGTAFSGTGTGTRTLKMGSGQWTLSGSAAIWNTVTATNLTLVAGSSEIIFSGTAGVRTFSAGTSGLSYNKVTFNANAVSNAGYVSLAITGTIATLNISGANYVQLNAGRTLTVTNALAIASTSGNETVFTSDTINSTATMAVAAGSTLSWVAIRDLIFTGSPTATNSFDLGHNTGITITAPQTGGGGIVGGWLLRGDLNYDNDNTPMFLNKAA